MKGNYEMKPSACMTNPLCLLVTLLLLVGTAFAAGETVTLNIGALPAGKSVTITYDVTVNRDLPLDRVSVSQQGTVSGSNFASLSSDDPDTPAANDPTLTPIDNFAPLAGFGSAVEFDGADDHIEIADGGSLNSPAYTIEAWVKLRTLRPSAIIFRTDAADTGRSNALYVNADGNFVHYADDGSSRTVTGTTRAVAGRWYHLAGVVESDGTMRLYVNGTEEGTAVSGVGPLWNGGERYLVGHDLATAGLGYLDGWLDELRIWNAGLSGAQISAWMHRGADASHASYANLVAYYKLDEAGAATAADSAGTLTATLVNMAGEPHVPTTVGEMFTNEDTAVAGRFVVSDPDGTSSDGLDLATGLTVVVDSVTLGSVSEISGNRFTFTPAADVNGVADITYRVYDGTAYSAPHTTTARIAPVADTPQVTAAVTNVNLQTGSGLVISRNPADGPEVAYFKISAISGGTLYQNDGTTRIDNGAFITFAQGNAGLRFSPTVDSAASGGFTVQASLTDSDTGLGGETASAVITVNRVPAFADTGSTLTVHQDADATDIRGLLHVSDSDSGQTLTWSVSAAPDHGGSLTIGAASAASGGADITPGGTISYQPAAGYAGSETFAIRVSDGIAATTRQITVTVASPPTVSGITPSVGPTGGGTPVTISGTNLTSVSAVKFGSSNAAGYTVDSATRITAVSPPGLAGAVDITVTTPGGTSAVNSADLFSYVAQPAVTGLTPSSGPLPGGTTVVISGTNLAAATAVNFGSSAAASFTVDSATRITAVSPPGLAGAVDITVTTAGGTSAASTADQFRFVAPPAVSSLSPSSGPLPGGTTVVISGTNLAGASAVNFGSSSASGFTVDSDTRITAISPPGSAGAVDVTVTSVGGTSATSSADLFTYVAAPVVSAVSPASGPSSGGTAVTITGSNLAAASAVRFGGSSAAITANSGTSITATSPAGLAGAVEITVTTAGGTSSTNPSDRFTYIATVTGAVVGNGMISCTSPVSNGAAASCIVTPDPGYRLAALTANSSDILAGVTLDLVTLDAVSEDTTVTATFSPASYGGRAVTSGSGDAGLYASVYAADGTQHLVYERDGSLYYRNSSLVSGTWSAEETVAVGHDPGIALKQDGTPLVAFLSNGLIRTTSRSNGSWSAPAETVGTGANSVELAIDGNDRLHLVYTAVGSDGYDDILYSTNRSGAFDTPAIICDGAYAGGIWTFCRTPLIQADTSGNYHIVYNKQQIYSSLGAHDPQWMVYTTNSAGGRTSQSHDLNSGNASGTPQPLVRGSFGQDPDHGFTLVYGNNMESSGLWLVEGLESGTWTETAAAMAGTLPVQGYDNSSQTRHLACITPDGRLSHASRAGADYSTLTELAPSGLLPFVNPVKRSVLYRSADANGVQQLFQVGIDAMALLTPPEGNLGAVIPAQTAEKTFTLTNNGSRPLSPAGVRTGHPGYTFEIAGDGCSGTTLAPGASCSFTVRNSHQDIPGSITDILTITSDDPVRGTITLPLSLQVVQPHYPLEITVTGSGSVTATASGQSDFTCSSGVCSREYDTSSIVSLSAQVPAGYSFSGFTFSGDNSACCRDASCAVTIAGTTRITATFTRTSYVIANLTSGNGALDCPSTVSHGISASCSLTPQPGYRIEGVGGSCGGTLSGTTYTTLPLTASCTVEAVFTAASQRSVNVTVGGSGAGGVYSAPAGIACSVGTCPALFDDATVATLTAVPDENSTFGGWSGACTNASGPCELAITADRSVTADFTAAPQARVGLTGYATLSAAYGATTNGSVIKARALTFTENLILGGSRRVTLEGGFNAPYDCNSCSENTLIRGSLTVEKGVVILENLTIR